MQASTTYLSVSQIKTFLQCPRQYRLRYIDKVRPEFRSASLAFGTAWHAAVGTFLWMSDAGPPPIEELLDRFKDALDRELAEYDVPVLFDDEESGLDALLERARAMLDTFVREFPMPSRVFALEEPFLLELAHPATGERLDLPLVGALDALVERDGKIIVLELKSAKRR